MTEGRTKFTKLIKAIGFDAAVLEAIGKGLPPENLEYIRKYLEEYFSYTWYNPIDGYLWNDSDDAKAMDRRESLLDEQMMADDMDD